MGEPQVCNEIVACAVDWHAEGISFSDWIEHAKHRHTGASSAARIAALEADRDEARRFGEEAAKRYNELIAQGPTLRCAFCDEVYPPGTPATQHESLTAHVRVCEKHPLRADLARLRAFARDVVDVAFDGCGLDGGEIQDMAEDHGLLVEKMMQEPCSAEEGACACAGLTEFPTGCYRPTPLLTGEAG